MAKGIRVACNFHNQICDFEPIEIGKVTISALTRKSCIQGFME